jgi:hypothetical protein
MLYQMLLGAWPLGSYTAAAYAAFVKRMQTYMRKALHEAKVHTSWINPHPAYDEAMQHYVAKMTSHDLHRRFTECYRTEGERITATIAGFPADEYGRGQDPIGERLARYVPWLSIPGVLVVRFEDLVGAAGGGSRERQDEAVDAVAQHVDRPLRPERVRAIADRVWSDKSSTFRQGRAGGWRDQLTPEQVALFKNVAGEQLIALGYETDCDWIG